MSFRIENNGRRAVWPRWEEEMGEEE